MITTLNLKLTEQEYEAIDFSRIETIPSSSPLNLIHISNDFETHSEKHLFIDTQERMGFSSNYNGMEIPKNTNVGLPDEAGDNVELDELIDTLPDFFKAIGNLFTSKDEKMIALNAGVVLTGATMPLVEINYSNQINYPALMLAVIFPPASGKGVVSPIKRIAKKVDQHLTKEANQCNQTYRQELDQYHAAVKKGQACLMPLKPLTPNLLCPGNITTAKLTDQLSNNGSDNMLIICETEADAFGLSATGGYSNGNSTILRQAFHFESVGQARMTDDGSKSADTPKMGVILAGTSDQYKNLFKENENGLFSRFLIVYGEGTPKWRDVKPCSDCPSIDHQIELLADRYYDLWTSLNKRKIEVRFSDQQWKEINLLGEEKFNHTYQFTAQETVSLALRHCNMIVRFAAILTVLRAEQDKITKVILYCSDQDFSSTLWLIKKSLACSLNYFKSLPKKVNSRDGEVKTLFFNHLPQDFITQTYLTIGKTLNISERSISRHIESFVKTGALFKVQKGHYSKTQVGKDAAVTVCPQ